MRRAHHKHPAGPCNNCGKSSPSPRPGLCFRCYVRDYENGADSQFCFGCLTHDKRVLGHYSIKDAEVVLCANCAQIARVDDLSLADLRQSCRPRGDRRTGHDRRMDDRRSRLDRRQTAQTAPAGSERRSSGRRLSDSAPPPS